MKPIRNIHAWLVALAFIATLAILFGGQAIAKKFNMTDPLKREFNKMKSIQSYSVNQEQDGLNVNLKLAEVNNLQMVLDKVREKTEFYYHKPVKSFTITDHTNKRLEEARYQLSFNLEEAVFSGRYLQLKEALNSYRDLRTRVYFSANFIYLQLEEGKHYHYEAYPRPANFAGDNASVSAESGGETG